MSENRNNEESAAADATERLNAVADEVEPTGATERLAIFEPETKVEDLPVPLEDVTRVAEPAPAFQAAAAAPLPDPVPMPAPALAAPKGPRVGTIVWGLILAILGGAAIAAGFGRQIDVQMGLIVVLGVAGVALLLGTIVTSARQK